MPRATSSTSRDRATASRQGHGSLLRIGSSEHRAEHLIWILSAHDDVDRLPAMTGRSNVRYLR